VTIAKFSCSFVTADCIEQVSSATEHLQPSLLWAKTSNKNWTSILPLHVRGVLRILLLCCDSFGSVFSTRFFMLRCSASDSVVQSTDTNGGWAVAINMLKDSSLYYNCPSEHIDNLGASPFFPLLYPCGDFINLEAYLQLQASTSWALDAEIEWHQGLQKERQPYGKSFSPFTFRR